MSIEVIQEAVRSFYARKDPGHDCSHAMRVRNTAIYLADKEGGDRTVVELAALLHDIGKETTLEKSHAGSSASLAVTILQKYNYPGDIVEKVKHCVLAHTLEIEPQTLEAKIVFDADKLDFCGAMGLARLFSISGSEGKLIYSLPGVNDSSAEEVFETKLRFFPERLYTATAKEILADHHQFALEFWRRLRQQINGPITTNTKTRPD
ncbi:MAG TPA: HD domain-containing protein [Verrucomicrobiae bacterium]|nr:HD domain-containing protein [Verrucomicrobiae bacterium]